MRDRESVPSGQEVACRSLRRSALGICLAALAGCASRGAAGSSAGAPAGAGGGPSALSQASGSAPTGATAGPLSCIGFPAPGAFVSGPAAIVVTGTAAGLSAVSVNGAPATIANGIWSIPETLSFGVNTFRLGTVAIGGAAAEASWSMIYGETFLDANEPLPGAVALGLSANMAAGLFTGLGPFSGLLPAGALAQAIDGGAGSSFGGMTEISVQPVTVAVSAALGVGVVNLAIDMPDFVVEYTFRGTTIDVDAANVDIAMGITLVPSGGALAAAIPETPLISFSSFAVSDPYQDTVVETTTEEALVGTFQTQLPAALTRELAQLFPPGPLAPDAVTITPADFVVSSASLVPPGTPHIPGPGYASRNGATSPAPDTSHDVSLAIREDLLNRALYSSWVASAPITIDQAVLDANHVTGVTLDASIFGLPPSPITCVIDPGLPPVMTVDSTPGAADPLLLTIGELHVALDFEVATTPVSVTLDVQAQFPAGVALSPGAASIQLGAPLTVTVDVMPDPILSSANMAAIQSAAQALVPILIPLVAPPSVNLPLPAVFELLPPQQFVVAPAGVEGDFLTIGGDL